MKTFVAAAGLAAGASAAVLPRQSECCFSLTASGGQSGQVGQLSDGQNRIGGGYPAGQYCLNGGSITDGNGRGCILTPPTTQLQCDEGATPDSGFSVTDTDELQNNGDSTFYACKATDNEYNIYTEQSGDQTGCVVITLSTGGQCGGGGSGGSSAPAASQPATSGETYPAGYTSSASQPAPSTETQPAVYTSPASQPTISPAGPASSALGNSASGYSAPGSSAPGYSASAAFLAVGESTRPVGSAPSHPQGVSTRIVTEYSTVCGCSEGASSGTPGVPASSESQLAESQPVPTQPAGYSSQPGESQPVPSQPTESSPVESTPAGSQPVPSQPAGSVPVPVPSQPAGYTSQPAPSQPAGSSSAPVESQPKPSQLASSATVHSQPAGYTSQSAPSQPAGSSSAPATETQPAGYTTQPASQTQPSSGSGSGSICQTSLVKGSYETPHLIVPVNSRSTDQSYGTGYNGYLSSENSTVFNFDIPQSDEGKTCSLVFLFPQKQDLETSDYTFNGQGSINFAQLSGPATEQTSYSSCPSTQQDLGTVTPQPGGSYVVQSGPCAAGTTETVRMSASGGLELEFFEDWNPSPLGLFITTC